jgi:hypothetical protein
VTGTYYPSGAPKFRGDPLTSNTIMTGTSYPSGAPKFRGDPLTSNNIVTEASYPSGASELCGDPLTLAHSHICQLWIAENYFRWRWTFWINIGNVVHNVRGNLSKNIKIKIGTFSRAVSTEIFNKLMANNGSHDHQQGLIFIMNYSKVIQ